MRQPNTKKDGNRLFPNASSIFVMVNRIDCWIFHFRKKKQTSQHAKGMDL